MPRITDLQVLVDRQTVLNEGLTAPLRILQENHPDADFTTYPAIADPRPDEAGCSMCDCATVGVMAPRTRKAVRVCREVISALKLASLVATNPREIRMYYKLRYIDDLPIMVSQAMPVYEAERQIAAGLMEIDGDDALVVHDLEHTDAQHCPGINCRSKRHPGCFDECSNLVKVIP